MNDYLSNLVTEQVNQMTKNIDECTTEEMVRLINQEDTKVAEAVKEEIPRITEAVDIIYKALSNGGRLFYLGAGTSGRLGVLDASECPPTYGTEPDLIQGFIAGGDDALRTAVEGSEDSEEEGKNQVIACGVTHRDVVVGISASGSAAYVIGALKQAKEAGAVTVGIVNNKDTRLEPLCDICISPVVGPEVIIGSTRMKAGTSQKLVLNMLTTATMIKLGKVYGNMMIDLKASNHKLYERAVRIIKSITDTDDKTAEQFLKEADMNTKLAVMMLLSGLPARESERILEENKGFLKLALKRYGNK
jgi:N-acetylmuramic acid 6-phosphate etherase